ncbi:hypothetical protein, partial [Kosakonia cowanii]|uniref:hypothetical protein n=1 Tax=Kosakonia cowanii TaxID=208223 RepID=UPI00289A2DA8
MPDGACAYPAYKGHYLILHMPDGAYAYPAYKGHHLVLRRPDKAQPPSGKQTALTRVLPTP